MGEARRIIVRMIVESRGHAEYPNVLMEVAGFLQSNITSLVPELMLLLPELPNPHPHPTPNLKPNPNPKPKPNSKPKPDSKPNPNPHHPPAAADSQISASQKPKKQKSQ